VLLEKLHSGQGAILDQRDYMRLADITFDLKDYRNQIVNYMLNTEHFYSLDIRAFIGFLKKILHFRLQSNNLVFKHLIQTIQICLCGKA